MRPPGRERCEGRAAIRGPSNSAVKAASQGAVEGNNKSPVVQATLLWSPHTLREGQKQRSHFSISQREADRARLTKTDSDGNSPQTQVWETLAERQPVSRPRQGKQH